MINLNHMHIEKFYTAMEHLLDVFDKNNRQIGFRCNTRDEYEAWKKEARKKLAEITGIDKMQMCDLKPNVISQEKMDGYERVKIIIQCEPDVYILNSRLILTYVFGIPYKR